MKNYWKKLLSYIGFIFLVTLTQESFMFRLIFPTSVRRVNPAVRFMNSLPDFGENFQVPIRDSILPLELTNSHPNDAFVQFFEKDHKYFAFDIPMEYSVTTLIGRYFEKFEALKIAEKMISGSKWPREGYLHQDGQPYSLEDILKQWESIGLFSRNRGTWMHYNIESYLNGLSPASQQMPEFEQFLDFYNSHIVARNMKPFRTEWRIASKELRIAGCVDFICQLPDGTFEIVDWKRAKDLQDKLTNNYGRKAKAPLSHLPDCDGSKYFLQLNIYRHILESEYGLRISAMTLATFHPSLDRYFAVEVPRWDTEVAEVLADLRKKRESRQLDVDRKDCSIKVKIIE